MSDTWGSDLSFGGAAGGNGNPMAGGPTVDVSATPPALDAVPEPAPMQPPTPITPPVQAQRGSGELFGAGLKFGPNYMAPDPAASALDQSALLLEQRVKRANEVATNPIAQFFAPDQAAAAREFAPAAAEKLQQIRQQQAAIKTGRVQAQTLGLAPGQVPDEATANDRIEVARSEALKGNLRVFKGLSVVSPEIAGAIQDQVYQTVSGHLDKAQLAFDSLSGTRDQGQYIAKLQQLRREGTLADLEALGLKVPASFDEFSNNKTREGQALREARIGMENLGARIAERSNGVPMEKKEAETYGGRLTTSFGDALSGGTWERINGKRVFNVNGMGDINDLGKKYALASPETRKAIADEMNQAVPKADLEKQRAFDRTYELATKDAKGNPVPEGKLNTNPNVQQGVAEGLASMLRGGSGGANVGLLKIELDKRGWSQQAIDGLISNYAGFMNTLFKDANRPYMSQNTQRQIRDVMDVIKKHNDDLLEDRVGLIARRAGALGLNASAIGFGKDEASGVITTAIEAGRQDTINRFREQQRATSAGNGGIYLDDPPARLVTDPDPKPGTVPRVPPPVQRGADLAPPPGAPAPGQLPPAGSSGSGQPPQGPAGGGSPQPVMIAGQAVNAPLPPGASPDYLARTQRIESGNKKDPWKATTGNGPDGKPLSSASGAFQFITSTWAANKPEGAPGSAKDATPEQQAAAMANLTAKNAASLNANRLPVNDTTLYMAHNLGAGGAASLLQADPDADARTVVGEKAAANNPKFFRGRPTVAMVRQRYAEAMEAPLDEGPKPKPGAGGAKAEPPGLMERVGGALAKAAANTTPIGQAATAFGMLPESAQTAVKGAAVEHAPAIGGTVGGIAGSAAGPVGAVAGGAVGGAAGQSLKDYIQGNEQSPARIAKEAALGGVFGVASEARPVVAAGARMLGAGAVEGGSAALEGKDAADATEAGLTGAGSAALGEAFGRALGMAGHKVYSMFAPNAQKAVQEAAGAYAKANDVLEKELPTIAGVGGKTGPNPAYEAAEKARAAAEKTLKDAGLKPDEAAYAYKVSTTEGGNIPTPKQEAQASRPGALEKERIGSGYQQLEQEVGAKGVGTPKNSPIAGGPLEKAANMPEPLQRAAERTEMLMRQPAENWQQKWVQLKDARSALLELERDWLSSTSGGRTEMAKNYRELADSVRDQQAKVAKYVFGEKDGEAFMQRLKVLDARYRRLIEATNDGELAAAARWTGEKGRDADKAFRAFAHDDPAALAAWAAMRKGSSNVENDVRTLVGMEKIPYVGAPITWIKMATRLREWTAERAAGSPAKFSDFINLETSSKGARDVLGAAGGRAATM